MNALEVINLKREISTLKAGGIGLLEKLEAETQRADKAEANLAALLEGCRYSCKCNQVYSCILCRTLDDLDISSKAFRQKLCDEIVGKIEASRTEVMEHTPCTDHIGFDNSIDIVKSVLKLEK